MRSAMAECASHLRSALHAPFLASIDEPYLHIEVNSTSIRQMGAGVRRFQRVNPAGAWKSRGSELRWRIEDRGLRRYPPRQERT
jgi:hypothetical protein